MDEFPAAARNPALIFRSAAVSCQGTGRRENQDATLVDNDNGLFVIADGVGCVEGSGVASAIACCQLLDRFETAMQITCSRQRHHDIVDCLKTAFRRTERKILHEQQTDRHLRHMASTALLTFIDRNPDTCAAGEARLYAANVGDSRLLLIRGDVARQLTDEHRIAQGLCDAGLISCEEASRHPERKTLYMHLGGCLHDGPDVSWTDLSSGDQLVLMTDGIWSQFTNAEIAETVRTAATEQQAATALTRMARERGSRDDVSCVVITVRTTSAPDARPQVPPASYEELFSTGH